MASSLSILWLSRLTTFLMYLGTAASSYLPGSTISSLCKMSHSALSPLSKLSITRFMFRGFALLFPACTDKNCFFSSLPSELTCSFNFLFFCVADYCYFSETRGIKMSSSPFIPTFSCCLESSSLSEVI